MTEYTYGVSELSDVLLHIPVQQASDAAHAIPHVVVHSEEKGDTDSPGPVVRVRLHSAILALQSDYWKTLMLCPERGAQVNIPAGLFYNAFHVNSLFTWMYTRGELADRAWRQQIHMLEWESLYVWLHQVHYMGMDHLQKLVETELVGRTNRMMANPHFQWDTDNFLKWITLARQYHCTQWLHTLEYDYLERAAHVGSLPTADREQAQQIMNVLSGPPNHYGPLVVFRVMNELGERLRREWTGRDLDHAPLLCSRLPGHGINDYTRGYLVASAAFVAAEALGWLGRLAWTKWLTRRSPA